METLTATIKLAQAPATPSVYPPEYSTFRCSICTQYHGSLGCDPRMVAHILRTS